jgi:hypothetical protein
MIAAGVTLFVRFTACAQQEEHTLLLIHRWRLYRSALALRRLPSERFIVG